MIDSLKKEMKKRLLDEKSRVETELLALAQLVKKEENTSYKVKYEEIGNSEDENATEVANYSNNISLEDTLEKLLRDIESALKRIEKNEYGICKYCAKEISEARLRARPTSSSCIECKKMLTQET
jgi:RNA polymerase-binding protein DksA